MSSQSIPSSASSTLGAPTARFEVNYRLVSGLGRLLVILSIAGLLIFSAYPSLLYRQDDVDSWIAFIVGILLIIIGFVAFFHPASFYRGMYIETYKDGLACIKSDSIQSVRWDEIAAVWQKIIYIQRYGEPIRPHYTYTIETIYRRKLKFSNEVKDIYGLGQMILNETTNRLLPTMWEAYYNGETLKFGSFSINKQGVMQGRKSLEWTEIESAEINNGYVTFKKQGKWFYWARVPAAKIPNLPVFLNLIDDMVGVKAGR